MLKGNKSREELDIYLEEKMKMVVKPREKQKIFKTLLEKFNISIDISSDMLTFRRNISEFTNFQVFAMLYVLNKKALSRYFTENEIAAFENEKMESVQVTFPLVFNNMIKISDDQWIGRTSFQELMRMKDARLINYDENEQRTLRRVKAGDTEICKIYINNRSVKEIGEALKENRYIPDDITLNMPLEGSEYSYSGTTLQIEKLPNNMFNIIDGYHRWVAMSNIYNFDKDFDYPMELRIVNYSTERANLFIFQKDQKNRMKKLDAVSYDPFSVSNKICQRLNEDSMSNIQGLIGRNNSLINMSSLSSMINFFFIKGTKKEEANAVTIKVKKILQDKFNYLTEQDSRYLTEKYSDKLLLAIMYLFSDESVLEQDYIELIPILTEKLKESPHVFDAYGRVRRKPVNDLSKCIEEWRKKHV